MSTRTRTRTRIPPVVTDPTGELWGVPTYLWGQAPTGLATRRQLAAKGLRPGGQPVAAQIRRSPRGRLVANLYHLDLARPQFAMTPAKRAAVLTAAAARRRCYGPCGRTDLTYIPRQGAPCYGVCWDCAGLPCPEPEPEGTRP